MNELIAIENMDGKETVNARELHTFLEVESRFNDWIKNRIFKYEFKEGEDYTCLTKVLVTQREDGQSGSANQIEYFLSLDMGKELSMVENNEKGKQARKYFIEVEKRARESVKPLSTLDYLAQSLKAMQEQAREIESQGNRITALEKNRLPIPANAMEEYTIPTALGKMFDPQKTGQAVNSLLQKAGLQYKAGGEWIPSREGEKWSKIIPTTLESGKAVYQVYWMRKVIEAIK